MNFWETLPKPFIALAPMDDVTDSAFRYMIAKYSKAHGGDFVAYTEFVSADGLVHADEVGLNKLMSKLRFDALERPIVAQLFTSVPENMERAARMVAELGFDGVDINMGCPDKTVEKQGCGSALIKNHTRAVELIKAAKRGAGELPVSVKTRVGYKSDNELEPWLTAILETGVGALALHARTRNDMSKVPARWELVKKAVEIRDRIAPKTKIIGNGDVANITEALERAKETGCDGVMIGRGIFGNPWALCSYEPTLKEKMDALIEHVQLFEEHFAGIKSFAVMKKHFASYIHGFDGAKQLRTELMEAENAREVRAVIGKNVESRIMNSE